MVISTKVGYGVEGCDDWTEGAVRGGIEEALRTLRADAIGVVSLHSCPAEILRRGDVVRALVDAKSAGWVRTIGYSGDNDDLLAAIELGVFDVLETSVSALDGWSLQRAMPKARGAGVIAKRALGNAPWRFDHRPDAPDLATYWDRWRAAPHLQDAGADRLIRYAAFAPGVSSTLIGTSSPERLTAAVKAVELGPLPRKLVQLWRNRSTGPNRAWPGVI